MKEHHLPAWAGSWSLVRTHWEGRISSKDAPRYPAGLSELPRYL